MHSVGHLHHHPPHTHPLPYSTQPFRESSLAGIVLFVRNTKSRDLEERIFRHTDLPLSHKYSTTPDLHSGQ